MSGIFLTSVAHGRIVAQKLHSAAGSSARSVLQGSGGDDEIARQLDAIPAGQPEAVWQGRVDDPRSGAMYTRDQIGQEQLDDLLAHFSQTAPTTRQIAMCLTRGTMIRTSAGEVAVEDLIVGDQVETLDDGPQTLRWIGSRRVRASGNLLPVRIAKNAFRPGSPNHDLLVSPKHRVVIRGWQAEVLFGQEEVLCTAGGLVNDDTITPAADMDEVEYFHLLFDSHQLIYSNNALTESFNPSEVALNAIEAEVRDEIYALFPQLRDDPASYGSAVRMVVTPKEAMLIWGS